MYRYKSTALLMALLSVAIHVYGGKESHEISKDYSKTVKSDAKTLDISNRFGQVRIITDETDEFVIKVKIRAWGKSISQAQDQLDRISIEETNSPLTASFHTKISGENISIHSNKGFEVNYEVHMPKSNMLDLKNRYGNSFVGDLDAKLKLDIQYGTVLELGMMRGKGSDINVKYISKVKIAEWTNGSIELAYNGQSQIELIHQADIEAKYGNLVIGEAHELDGNVKYGNIDIGVLKGAIEMGIKYGNIEINKIAKTLSHITIEGMYGNIALGMDGVPNIKFEVGISYGNFGHTSLKTTRMELEKSGSSHITYRGLIGNSPNISVSISNRYGNITLSN